MTMPHVEDGTCVYHVQIAEDLKEIKADTKAILSRLATGDVTFATIKLRVERLERVVYFVCGALGAGFVAALCAALFK